MSLFEVSKFDPQPSPELICCICYCVLNEPRESRCRHVFCKDCIETWLRNHQTCPTCRNRIRTRHLKPVLPLVQNMLNSLSMICEFREKGCQATVTMEQYENHVKNCDYQITACNNTGCEERLLRKTLKEHQETCQYRTVKCTNGCELSLPVLQNQEHDCVTALKDHVKAMEAEMGHAKAGLRLIRQTLDMLRQAMQGERSQRRQLRRFRDIFSQLQRDWPDDQDLPTSSSATPTSSTTTTTSASSLSETNSRSNLDEFAYGYGRPPPSISLVEQLIQEATANTNRRMNRRWTTWFRSDGLDRNGESARNRERNNSQDWSEGRNRPGNGNLERSRNRSQERGSSRMRDESHRNGRQNRQRITLDGEQDFSLLQDPSGDRDQRENSEYRFNDRENDYTPGGRFDAQSLSHNSSNNSTTSDGRSDSNNSPVVNWSSNGSSDSNWNTDSSDLDWTIDYEDNDDDESENHSYRNSDSSGFDWSITYEDNDDGGQNENRTVDDTRSENSFHVGEMYPPQPINLGEDGNRDESESRIQERDADTSRESYSSLQNSKESASLQSYSSIQNSVGHASPQSYSNVQNSSEDASPQSSRASMQNSECQNSIHHFISNLARETEQKLVEGRSSLNCKIETEPIHVDGRSNSNCKRETESVCLESRNSSDCDRETEPIHVEGRSSSHQDLADLSRMATVVYHPDTHSCLANKIEQRFSHTSTADESCSGRNKREDCLESGMNTTMPNSRNGYSDSPPSHQSVAGLSGTCAVKKVTERGPANNFNNLLPTLQSGWCTSDDSTSLDYEDGDNIGFEDTSSKSTILGSHQQAPVSKLAEGVPQSAYLSAETAFRDRRSEEALSFDSTDAVQTLVKGRCREKARKRQHVKGKANRTTGNGVSQDQRASQVSRGKVFRLKHSSDSSCDGLIPKTTISSSQQKPQSESSLNEIRPSTSQLQDGRDYKTKTLKKQSKNATQTNFSGSSRKTESEASSCEVTKVAKRKKHGDDDFDEDSGGKISKRSKLTGLHPSDNFDSSSAGSVMQTHAVLNENLHMFTNTTNTQNSSSSLLTSTEDTAVPFTDTLSTSKAGQSKQRFLRIQTANSTSEVDRRSVFEPNEPADPVHNLSNSSTRLEQPRTRIRNHRRQRLRSGDNAAEGLRLVNIPDIPIPPSTYQLLAMYAEDEGSDSTWSPSLPSSQDSDC